MKKDEIRRAIDALMTKLKIPASNWHWLDSDLCVICKGNSESFRIPTGIMKHRFAQITRQIEDMAARRAA